MNQLDELRWLADQDAHFALPFGQTKDRFPTNWPNEPHTVEEAIAHAAAGGNVGILTGQHSGGIVALDRDVRFPETVDALGRYGKTVKIVRSNAGDRGKFLYRCKGTLPKTTVWRAHPKDPHPAAEFLAKGRHALCPPSQYNGGLYQLADRDLGILEVTPEELDRVWWMITGTALIGRKRDDKSGKFDRDFVTRVKDAWTAERVFKHHGKVTETVEDHGEHRLVGNGGLLVGVGDLAWRWYCHADGAGGDQVDAWAWCKRLDRMADFAAIIGQMAEAAGVPLPTVKPSDENGKRDNATQNLHSDNELPVIATNNRQLSDLMRETMAAIVEHGKSADPLLFVRSGRLVRLAADENGALRTDLVTPDSLLGIMAQSARWVKIERDKRGTEKVTNTPPSAIVARVLCAEAGWDLPVLEGITHAPIFGADGSLHKSQGYNPVTRLYHAGAVNLGDTTPTAANVATAVGLLTDDLFVDFPLDTPSMAHAIALAILPFVRPMIKGATPLHLATAPQHRAGKSLLVESALYPALGRTPDMTSDAGDEAEWAKVLTSKLLSSPSCVVLDNLSAELRSPMLATAISEARLTSRILGGNTEVSAPARWVWAATGKNTTLHEELMLRSVLIRLEPDTEQPEARTGFKHPNQLEWVAANRDRIATAIVTIVRNWVENAKRKPFTGRAKGRFESWVGTMGGILAAAGIAGFLGNEAELRATSAPEADAFRAFVLAWYAKHGASPVTAKELFMLASTPDNETEANKGLDLLGEVLGGKNEHGRKVAFGTMLSKYAGRVYGMPQDPAQIEDPAVSCRIMMHPEPTRERVKQWFLQEFAAGSSSQNTRPRGIPPHVAVPVRGVLQGLAQPPAGKENGRGSNNGAHVKTVECGKTLQDPADPAPPVDNGALSPAEAAWLDDAEGDDHGILA